jgi:hypothetical protein
MLIFLNYQNGHFYSRITRSLKVSGDAEVHKIEGGIQRHVVTYLVFDKNVI